MTGGWTGGTLRADAARAPLEIVKIGGSLLTRPGWPELLAELLFQRRSPRRVLVVVGGGAIVDGLRAIDAVAPQAVGITHVRAIGLLGTTARLVADVLELPVVAEPATEPAAVLDVPAWLAAGDRLARLPVGWHVTSDSIAAEVAAFTGGDLLLVKAATPPEVAAHETLEPLAHSGWVDPYFPRAAGPVGRIEWMTPAPAATSVPVPGVVAPGGQGGGPRGR